jgi:hypothetical protein
VAGTTIHLQRFLLMLVDVGCCRVMRCVPDLYSGQLGRVSAMQRGGPACVERLMRSGAIRRTVGWCR